MKLCHVTLPTYVTSPEVWPKLCHRKAAAILGEAAFSFRELDKNYRKGSTHHMKGLCIQNPIPRTLDRCPQAFKHALASHAAYVFLNVVCLAKPMKKPKRTGYGGRTHRESVSTLARSTEGQGWITPYSTPMPDKINAQPSRSKERGSMSWSSGCWNLILKPGNNLMVHAFSTNH